LNDRYSGDGQCDLKGVDIDGLERDEIVFFTSSLGSRMMFDTLIALKTDKAKQNPVEISIARTNLVFMLANQIPLFDLGLIDRPIAQATEAALVEPALPSSGLSGFVRAWSDIR